MTKVQIKQKAFKLYPVRIKMNMKGTGEYDSNLPRRKAYIAGYRQALDDLLHFLHHGYMLQSTQDAKYKTVDEVRKSFIEDNEQSDN